MECLKGLQPEKVFYFFEEMCKIPHGSGNTKQISDYLVGFAMERNLEHYQDESGNVVMIQEATEGYEDQPAVILQGHMDMVAVHKPELTIDMTKEPLKPVIDGDFVYAEGTSLGGDDGIAVAYALAILDSKEIKHPRLEVVITVDEEIGLLGAASVDLSKLKGQRLLNIDSEEEGIFLTSCAGGVCVTCHVETQQEEKEGVAYEVVIGGLQGGHSGTEIGKERSSANMLTGRLLYQLTSQEGISLYDAQGGLADNAICRETILHFLVAENSCDAFEQALRNWRQSVCKELQSKESGLFVEVRRGSKEQKQCITGTELKKIAAFLYALPGGVQAMSVDVPGLVETSLNMGILRMTAAETDCAFSVRSSIETAKEALVARLEAITTLAGGKIETTGDYPGWAYRVQSPLREKMITLYETMFGEKPQVQAIHAGLECGILASKIKDMDAVSFGPNILDIHTTEERLSISSTQRVWEFLIALLETKDEA